MTDTRGRIPLRYLMYGFLFFVLVVAILFPYKRVAETMISRLEASTDIGLTYEDLSYAFLIGCAFDQVEITLPLESGRIRAYKGDRLALRLSLFSLIRKELKLRIQGEGYGGEAEGEVRLSMPPRPEWGTYRLDVRDLRYEEIVAPFYMRNFKISGSLTGEANVKLQGKDLLSRAAGSLAANLEEGTIRNIFIQGMPLPDFAFRRIEARASLLHGKIELEECRIDSEILLGEIRGDIALNADDIRDSSLNLLARLKPLENDPINLHGVATFFHKDLDADGYYAFRMSGTFRYPELL